MKQSRVDRIADWFVDTIGDGADLVENTADGAMRLPVLKVVFVLLLALVLLPCGLLSRIVRR